MQIQQVLLSIILNQKKLGQIIVQKQVKSPPSQNLIV